MHHFLNVAFHAMMNCFSQICKPPQVAHISETVDNGSSFRSSQETQMSTFLILPPKISKYIFVDNHLM